MITRRLTIFLLAVATTTALLAQQQRQAVVTRRIEKTFPYREGYDVNIEGEKAEVTIETWDRQEVSVLLELSASHPSRERAAADLDAARYQAERVKNRIYLRNYLSPEEGKKPESMFSARYTIRLPKECPVYLKNHFGEATISDLANGLKVNSEFTRLGLENIRGQMDIWTRFGDLMASRLDGNMTVNARRSNITLKDIKGRYDITAQYGVLNIFTGPELIDLRINADKSEVYLFSPNPKLFAYNLEAVQSDIRLPNGMSFRFVDNTDVLKKATFKPQQEYSANITITVRFGELIVSKK